MSLPPLPLVVLRSAATLVLSAVIGQAGWAAAFLGGQDRFRAQHETGAWVTLLVAVGSAVLYLALRRWAGQVTVTLAVLLALAVGVQVWLGRTGQTATHIFSGVLIAMLATALTSWTFRHPGPADGAQRPSSASSIPRSQ